MRKQYLLYSLFTFVLFLMGCSKDEITGNENTLETPEEIKIPKEFKDCYLNATIQINGINAADFYKGCSINSIYDETAVSEGTMRLQSNINKQVQTYFLTGEGEKIYLMTRVSDTEKNKNIEFNVENTALAFVTFHPFFAGMDSLAYDVLKEAILQSQNFPKVQTEINNIIIQKQDLYSKENTELFDALSSLLDELMVFTNFKTEETISRTITNETRYFPFRLNSSANRLDLQVLGVNPNFYGKATHANGNIERLVVKSHEDFGLLAGLESVWNIISKKGWQANQYGEIESYTFPAEGECRFHFSSNTNEGQLDLIARILSSAAEMAGIYVDNPILTYADYVKTIVQEVNNSSYELATPSFPFFSIAGEITVNFIQDRALRLMERSIEQAFDNEIDIYNKLKTTANDKNNDLFYNNRIKYLQKAKIAFKRVMGIYSILKGTINSAARIIAACKASNPVEFKFNYYNNEIRNWTHIQKHRGDNQTGVYEAELEDPISVAVNADMAELSDYVVKFEVLKGGGTVGNSGKKIEYVEIKDYTVETRWTLGEDSEEQIVRACLCEKESKEEVCEPVEFVAKAEPELLAIYIEKTTYEKAPSYHDGIVTFNPTLTIYTDETEKLDNLYDWGLIIYKEDEAGIQHEMERIEMGKEYDTIDLTREFKLEKSELNLDYTNFIAQNNDKFYIGSYVIYQENGKQIDSDVIVPIELIYESSPSLTIKDLETGATTGKWPDLYTSFKFRLEVIGALWMDKIYMYLDDSYNDGSREKYSPSDEANYIIEDVVRSNYDISFHYQFTYYYWTLVNGKEIKSDKIIHGCKDGHSYLHQVKQ